MEFYVNTYWLGSNSYGVEQISLTYFGKSAKELNLEEAIVLAGIPKAPNKYNPVTDYDAAIGQLSASKDAGSFLFQG